MAVDIKTQAGTEKDFLRTGLMKLNVRDLVLILEW